MNEKILAVLEDIKSNTSNNYDIESYLEKILKKIEKWNQLLNHKMIPFIIYLMF